MRHLAASTRSSISTATAVKASCRARCRMTSMDGRGWGNVTTLPRDTHSRTCVMRTVCEAARARGVALSLPCGLGLVREDATRPCSAADGHRRRRGPRLRLTRNNWHWLIPTLHADVQTTQRRSTACLAQQQWRARTCGLGAAPSAWAMGGGGGGGMCWEMCCSRDTSVRVRALVERVDKRTAVPRPPATPPASRSSSACNTDHFFNNTLRNSNATTCE